MADTETTTPTVKNVIIQGASFEMPLRYTEGHTLTAIEAGVLNQTLSENIRNNFAKTVIASKEGAEGSIPANKLAAAFAEFYNSYEFSAGRSGSTKGLDPIEKEALKVARDIVHAKLRKNDKPIRAPKDASDEAKEAYKAKIDSAIDRYAQLPEVIADAKANIKRREKLVEATVDELD